MADPCKAPSLICFRPNSVNVGSSLLLHTAPGLKSFHVTCGAEGAYCRAVSFSPCKCLLSEHLLGSKTCLGIRRHEFISEFESVFRTCDMDGCGGRRNSEEPVVVRQSLRRVMDWLAGELAEYSLRKSAAPFVFAEVVGIVTGSVACWGRSGRRICSQDRWPNSRRRCSSHGIRP